MEPIALESLYTIKYKPMDNDDLSTTITDAYYEQHNNEGEVVAVAPASAEVETPRTEGQGETTSTCWLLESY